MFVEKTQLLSFQGSIDGLEVEVGWNLIPFSFLSLVLLVVILDKVREKAKESNRGTKMT